MFGSINPSILASVHEFTRCQRPDGTTYGTAGTCRKGSAVSIQRRETGLFSVKDDQGRNVGSIMAEDAFTGGGGIREPGKQARYTVTVGKQKKEGLTLQKAKQQAREWLGESQPTKPQTQLGKISPRKLKNMKGELDEHNEAMKEAKRKYEKLGGRSGPAAEINLTLKKFKFHKEQSELLKERIKRAEEVISEFYERVNKDELECNKPKATPDHPTKSHIVKACYRGKEEVSSGGTQEIKRFGQQGVKGSPKKEGESEAYKARRESFQARHAKNIEKGPSSSAYWADKVKW